MKKVAKRGHVLVAYYGLDEEVGPIRFCDSSGQNERLLAKPYSENKARLIDIEVHETRIAGQSKSGYDTIDTAMVKKHLEFRNKMKNSDLSHLERLTIAVHLALN